MKVIWGWTLSVEWVNPLVEQKFKKAQKVVGGIVLFYFFSNLERTISSMFIVGHVCLIIN
jgi:hypothetical protein